MTSKEKLQELKEQIQEEMADYWQGYERQEYETHKYDEDFDSIIKDLEILEILKNKPEILTFVRRFTTYENYRQFNNQTRILKEEFDKVKRWLENDR